MSQQPRFASTHRCLPRARFLLLLGASLATALSGVGRASDDPSASPSLAEAAQSAPIYLEIPPRRQWDCNYGNLGVNCCRGPGNPNAPAEEVENFFDSCPGSPRPDSDRPLPRRECRCGEGQCYLAGLCGANGRDGIENPTGWRPVQCETAFSDSAILADSPNPNCSGYCGSASVQQSSLWQGAYVSQGLIRRLAENNDTSLATEILIDPGGDTPDLETAVSRLGFATQFWYAEGPYPDSRDRASIFRHFDEGTNLNFLDWVESQLFDRNPVIVGLFLEDVDARGTGYDHITAVTGIERSGRERAVDTTLVVNDNYSSVPREISGQGVQNTEACATKFCLALSRPDSAAEPCGAECTSYGVAVQRPKGTRFPDHPVRVQVVGCEGGACELNGQRIRNQSQRGGPDGWMEPNWTVNQIGYAVFELKASVDTLPTPDENYVIARVNARDVPGILGLAGRQFSAVPHACYAVAAAGAEVDVGIVYSDQAAFFRLENEAEVDCPAVNAEFVPDHEPLLVTCEAVPREPSACLAPESSGAATLSLRKRADADKNSMSFNMTVSGDSFDIADPRIGSFGDPVAGAADYLFCLYDERQGNPSLVLHSEVRAGGDCEGDPCWKRLQGDKGFRYRDSEGLRDGVTSLSLTTGGSGNPVIQWKARGANLPLPALPLSEDPGLTAQILNGDGECWSASFSAPARKNKKARFLDSSD